MSLVQLADLFDVPENLLVGLLMLPPALVITVASRHVIGLRGLGLSLPLLIGYGIAALPFPHGLLFLVIIAGLSMFFMRLLKNVPLLAQPRLALVMIGLLALTLILVITGAGGQQLTMDRLLYPILLLLFTSEWFSKAEVRQTHRSSFILVVEVVVTGLIVYLWLVWPFGQELVIDYPWQTFLAASFLIAFLGRWRGLRLTEYLRFAPLIDQHTKGRDKSR